MKEAPVNEAPFALTLLRASARSVLLALIIGGKPWAFPEQGRPLLKRLTETRLTEAQPTYSRESSRLRRWRSTASSIKRVSNSR